ncbi:MAG: hypothetical protein GX139_04050 [Armatimonadetes bacterium]|jgi:hypothetical protein|nr:hypothetical protein [Armatimonadota bacterium]
MKIRAIVVAFIILGFAATLCSIVGCGRSEPAELVAAWQLTPSNKYSATLLVDPVVSWAADSRSLLFSIVAGSGNGFPIMHWEVGAKSAKRIVDGVCPTFISEDKFVYMTLSPKEIVEYDMSDGGQKIVVQNFAKNDMYRDVTGFSYDPADQTYQLRVSDFTEFYQPGCVAIDSMGRQTGLVPPTTGGGVLDRSVDPGSGRCAIIYADAGPRELRIADKGKEESAKPIVKGNLGAVAWSPDSSMIAFADFADVKLLDPKDNSIRIIARLGDDPYPGRSDHVCRLIWSPDNKYLAALKIVSYDQESLSVLYVLDMTTLSP